jgi:hypothetical protein
MVTDSSQVEVFIEFKWKLNDDPFCDVYDMKHPDKDGKTVKSFLCDTKADKDTLGQITACAAAQLGSQLRTHIYSVLIIKDTARLLRWNRSGTVVTEAIKYNKSGHLAKFFCCYSKASPAMHGKDQSISHPTLVEAAMARRALNLNDLVPLVKCTIPGMDSSLLYHIAASPQATFYIPPGHATRAFPVYDVSQCS